MRIKTRLFNIVIWIWALLWASGCAAAAEIVWDPPPPVACAVGESDLALGLAAAGLKPAARAPLIVVVIDDMGVDRWRSAAVLRLPAPLTLAYLPYGHDIQKQVDAGRAAGHGIMMHVPMQPRQTGIDPGPNVLRGDLGEAELRRRIAANLDSFSGYQGINNHMGSAFTQDRAGLDVLMEELKARQLFFLDSMTHAGSQGEQAAIVAGVPAAHRDVFLDHVETAASVGKALAAVEKRARQNGFAIAIGHPKDVTITALQAWLPGLADKGFEVVTLETLITRRRAQAVLAVKPETPAE